MKKKKLKCELCGEYFIHLGSHIWHKHKLKANQYKERFGLDHKTALISKSVYDKKHKHFEQNRDKYLTNFLEVGKKFQFKKGEGKTKVNGYISQKSKRRAMEQIIKVNENREKGRCPVCNIIFDNLDGHLYNKHKLMRVNYLK